MSAAPQKLEGGRAGKGVARLEPVIKEVATLGVHRRIVRINRGVYLVVHNKNGVEQVLSNKGWSVYTGPAARAPDEAIEEMDDYEGAVSDDDNAPPVGTLSRELPPDDESAHETEYEGAVSDGDDTE